MMLATLILGLGLGVSTELSPSWEVAASAGYGTRESMVTAELLGHFYGLESYDRYFGYSSFDPFVALGVRTWIGSWDAVGPKVGLGAFYHLDDHWSLKVDMDATLAVDREPEVRFSLFFGLNYSF